MANLAALAILNRINAGLNASLTGGAVSKPNGIRYATYRGTRPGPVRPEGASVSVAIESTSVTLLVGGVQVQVEKTTLTAALFRSLAQVGSTPAGPLTIARGARGPLSLLVSSPRRARVWLPQAAVANLANLLST